MDINLELKNKILEFLLYYLKEHYYFRKKDFIYAFLTSYLKLGKTTTKYNDIRIFLSKIVSNLYVSSVLQKHSNTVFKINNNSYDIIKEIVFSIPYISNLQVRDLYLREKLNMTEISKIIGCNISTVSQRLKDMKIDTLRNGHPEKELKIKNEEIKKLYLEDNLTLKKISEIALCCTETISRRLKKMGVELRDRNNNRLKISNERIKYLYINEGINLTEISKIANCSSQVIRNKLELMDIKIRKYKKLNISNEQIKELYLKEKMSINKISKITGCNSGTLGSRLKSMGVELRGISKQKNNNYLF